VAQIQVRVFERPPRPKPGDPPPKQKPPIKTLSFQFDGNVYSDKARDAARDAVAKYRNCSAASVGINYDARGERPGVGSFVAYVGEVR
jgi:hypothetical protein